MLRWTEMYTSMIIYEKIDDKNKKNHANRLCKTELCSTVQQQIYIVRNQVDNGMSTQQGSWD